MSAKCNTDYEKTVFIPDNGILLGTSYNSVISEQDINDLQSFEQWSGKKYSIVVIFQGFSPDEQTPFPKTQLNNIWLNSNTPLLTLEPWGSNIIDEINNGTLDPYLEEYAISLENWTQENWAFGDNEGKRKQVFIRFGHEMNLHDEAYPWCNKSPESYQNAWRRVHDIFERPKLAHDTIQWVWCVNQVDVPFNGYRAEEYYPGDEYVDWVAIDGYNVGRSVPYEDWDNWTDFDSVFGPMLDRFDSHPNISGKPYAIVEFASSSIMDNKPVKEFNIYTNEDSPTNHYFPSGWMGDTNDITFYDNNMVNSHYGIACGNSCIKILYSADAAQGNYWAGIYWLDPEYNWGDEEGGYDLAGATKLTFWAKGENGGEKSKFSVGGLGSIDTAISTDVITLSNEWTQYSIDLTGKDPGCIIGGFCWLTGYDDNPMGATIYLDDIRYESSTGIPGVCIEEGTSSNQDKGNWILDAYDDIKDYPKIKLICYFNIDKGGTKYLTGESDWAVYTTPNDNRNNIDDCSFESNKRIIQYQQSVTDPYYVYQFPLYTAPKGDLDGDGKVTGFDIPIVLGLVFDQEYISEADTDDNGYVNIIDVRRITQEINK